MSMGDWGRMIASELLDVFFPPGLYCTCCGKITDDTRTYGLCNDCMRDIKWVSGRTCAKCGKVMSETDPGEVCFYCRSNEHSFDKGYACAEYGEYEKTLLYELKYASRGDIGKAMGEIVYDRMAAEFGEAGLALSYDMVLPVPLYIIRKKRRGFNQAELIAEEFAERSGIRMENKLLIRSKETVAMKGLGPAERRANIQGAFTLREGAEEILQGARILMLDDIFTTGATLDEAALVLKNAGASRVDFCVFAAGADYTNS